MLTKNIIPKIVMDKNLFFGLLCVLLFPLTSAAGPGAMFCGPYAKSKAITFNDTSNVAISGLEISSKNGTCITLNNCHNVKITKCRLGPSGGCGIQLYNCTNVIISDCRIANVTTGVYAIDSRSISVTHIQAENITGAIPRGQMVQFDNVSGPGNRVNYNVCENIPGKSDPEDIINMFKTRGTPADPVQIIGNWIRGGGPSTAGGGILTGDSGGAYILVKDNILVNPGEYGIGIAAGTHIKIINNKIYAKKERFTNVGLYIWNQYPNKACAADTITGNHINWTDSSGNSNPSWNAGNCGTVTGWDSNTYDTSITAAALPEKIITACPENGPVAATRYPLPAAKNKPKLYAVKN